MAAATVSDVEIGTSLCCHGNCILFLLGPNTFLPGVWTLLECSSSAVLSCCNSCWKVVTWPTSCFDIRSNIIFSLGLRFLRGGGGEGHLCNRGCVCNTPVKNSGYILDNLGSVNIKVTSISYPSIGWPASHDFIHFVNCSHSDCSIFVAGKSCGRGTIMAKPHPEKAASAEVFLPPSFLLSLGNILTCYCCFYWDS